MSSACHEYFILLSDNRKFHRGDKVSLDGDTKGEAVRFDRLLQR